MEFKVPKAQAAKLLFLVLSLTLIPFMSSSLRPSYLYFLLNILIIVLGYESGVLHVLVEPDMEKKKKPVITAAPVASSHLTHLTRGGEKMRAHEGSQLGKPSAMAVAAERTILSATAEKTIIITTTTTTTTTAAIGAAPHNMKKAPSLPSLFFIGSCDEEGDAAMEEVDAGWEEEEEEDVFAAAPAGEISGQELFARAESFIGNFYNQLKIQREESWKKIHGFYHRTF